jgi:uncharacterized protein (TIGR03067 family)
MRARVSCFVSCLSAVLLAGAFAGCDDSATGSGPGTPTELQGTWAGHMTATGGYTVAATATFSGSAFSIAIGTTAEAYGGTFTLNTTTSPKQMDACMARTTVNQAYVGKTSLCIYRVSGDTLTYAGNAPGATQRPTALVPVDSTIVFVLVKQ